MAQKLESGVNVFDYATDRNIDIYNGTFGRTDGTNPSSMEVINDFIVKTKGNNTTQDKINRVFYKNMCKEFTSDGSPITVNNGMDGYVLSGVLQGQTVKNLFNGSTVLTLASPDRITIDNTNLVDFNGFVFKNLSSKSINLSVGTFSTLSFKKNITVPSKSTYIFLADEYLRNMSGWYSDGWTASDLDKAELLNTRVVVNFPDYVKSYIPFGLSSTQAIVSNNGLKYSF